jgi:hypothetical protein
MKITPIKHGLEDLIGKSGPRTPGVHMSALYGDLYQDLEPTRYVRGGTPDPLRLEAGLAFEQFLEDALRVRLLQGERPPEFTHTEPGIVEPILFNPDLIIFNGATRVGEIKLTWMSSREMPREEANNFPDKVGKWITQMQSYCYCLETNEARLIGFFVNGDWQLTRKGGAWSETKFAPELLAWNVTFTSRELRDNWSMLRNHGFDKGLIHAA